MVGWISLPADQRDGRVTITRRGRFFTSAKTALQGQGWHQCHPSRFLLWVRYWESLAAMIPVVMNRIHWEASSPKTPHMSFNQPRICGRHNIALSFEDRGQSLYRSDGRHRGRMSHVHEAASWWKRCTSIPQLV